MKQEKLEDTIMGNQRAIIKYYPTIIKEKGQYDNQNVFIKFSAHDAHLE